MAEEEEFRSMIKKNPFPSQGAAVAGLDITKMMICRDDRRASEIRSKLINNILLKANKGAGNEGDTRVFALIGNVGKGKTHLIQHMIRKANGDDVSTIGLDIPDLSNVFTAYTITYSPTQKDAARENRIYSWLFNRIMNIEDLPKYEMGMINSPSLPKSKRSEFSAYIDQVYKEETGHESLRSLAPMSFEEFFKLFEKSVTKALTLSGRKGMFLVLDEMEGPIENLAQKSKDQLTLFVESLRALIDRLTKSDLPVYLVFCFTIQPWHTLETSESSSVVSAFMTRLRTNSMILSVEFSDDEIGDFIAQSIRACAKDKEELDRIIKRGKLAQTFPFCEEAPEIMRRYTRGDPRFVCLNCNKLFEEWYADGISLTPQHIASYLEKGTTFNMELFKALCDRLGDRYSYIIKILKDHTRKLEFDVEEIEDVILEKCGIYGVPSERERIATDLHFVAANHEEALVFDEKKNRYYLGGSFQETYGLLLPKGAVPGLSPKLQVEHRLKETRVRLQDNPDTERLMLLDGLDNLYTREGLQHSRLPSAIVVNQRDGINGVYFPVIGTVNASDVENAVDVAKKNDADYITFVGRIPTANKMEPRAREILESIDHPKSEEYFSAISALKDICRKVGTQEDLRFIESNFSRIPFSKSVFTHNIYQGIRNIDGVQMDSHIWLMAIPNLLEGVGDKEAQDQMNIYIDNKIKPELDLMLDDKAPAKIKELKASGRLDKYLATDDLARSVKKLVHIIGPDKIVVGIDPGIVAKWKEEKTVKALQTLGLLTDDCSLSGMETLRGINPVLWIMIAGISKSSPDRKKIIEEFKTGEPAVKRHLNATIDVLVDLSIVTEESGKLHISFGGEERQLELLSGQLQTRVESLKKSGIALQDTEAAEIRDLLIKANESIMLIGAGKPSKGVELIPRLNKKVGIINALMEKTMLEAKSLLRDMSPEAMERDFMRFSRAYSDAQESSDKLNLTEAELREYLPSLVELDPPFAELSGRAISEFKSKANDLTDRIGKEEFGYVVAHRDDYTLAKKNLEVSINKARNRIGSNLRQYASTTHSLQNKISNLISRCNLNVSVKMANGDVRLDALERLSYAEEINRLIDHRRKLTKDFQNVMAEIENKIILRIGNCSRLLKNELDRLGKIVVRLQAFNILDKKELQNAENAIGSIKNSMRLDEVKIDFERLRVRSSKPGGFESAVNNEVWSYFEKEIGAVDSYGEFGACGPRSKFLDNIRNEINCIPKRMLHGEIRELYETVKSQGRIDAESWEKLETKYGDKLSKYLGELIRLDLLEIR